MPAVVGESKARDELGVAEHGGHALAGDVIVDGKGLVGAGSGSVHSGAIKAHFNQGSVITDGAFESSKRIQELLNEISK